MTFTAAQLDTSGTVVNIAVFPDDVLLSPEWVAYTDSNPAVIGGDYVDGFFYSPQPFPSWSRSNGEWQPPTPMPSQGGPWLWDEDTLSWVEVTA